MLKGCICPDIPAGQIPTKEQVEAICTCPFTHPKDAEDLRAAIEAWLKRPEDKKPD